MTMKKKPRLKQIFDNLDNLTNDDIENLEERKWIKEAFKVIKDQGLKTEKDIQARIDGAITHDIYGNPSEKFFIRKWNSDEEFIQYEPYMSDTSSGFEIDIMRNEPILIIPIESAIIIGSHRVKISAKSWTSIIQKTLPDGKMTRSEYYEYYQKFINTKYGV